MMRKHTVLICDDNMAIHSSLTSYLKAEGIEVISAFDGETALQELRRQSVDVMVLDVMLPGMDGYEVCREVRKFSDVHIIMLSAKGEELDRIVGLEVGADDYVSKPFSPREVVIRIKKALKRLYPKQEPKKLTLAELTILPDSYEVYIRNQKVDLTSKETDVLSFLVSNAGKALTREHILNAAWGYEYCGDTRVVDSLIKRLRQKLPADGVHFAIRSIYGVGYKIEELQ
ncbi:MAG: response regulator transcription factor [Oscillospiraceae bacterium]